MQVTGAEGGTRELQLRVTNTVVAKILRFKVTLLKNIKKFKMRQKINYFFLLNDE